MECWYVAEYLFYIAPENVTHYGTEDFAQADFSHLDNNVVVPEIEFNLQENHLQQLQQQIQPVDEDGNYGINHFVDVVNFINNIVD